MQQCKSEETLLLARARVHVSSIAVVSQQAPRWSLADSYFPASHVQHVSSKQSLSWSRITHTGAGHIPMQPI